MNILKKSSRRRSMRIMKKENSVSVDHDEMNQTIDTQVTELKESVQDIMHMVVDYDPFNENNSHKVSNSKRRSSIAVESDADLQFCKKYRGRRNSGILILKNDGPEKTEFVPFKSKKYNQLAKEGNLNLSNKPSKTDAKKTIIPDKPNLNFKIKPLETLYEEKYTSTGQRVLMSKLKLHRKIDHRQFNCSRRHRKRLLKAQKLGYTPLTLEQEEILDVTLKSLLEKMNLSS
ncbi:hypothetical protein A3Q56_01478 [Intoshia linei]|uniref:Uncharacterized protein n=1 Tax=Intoshia linei TaxID=1819745 RepID=A0A177B909_9BILA|nr:hypothetical protein A3Q56_01478 [Intoshia linei]